MTWFSTQGLDTVVRQYKGSRPGITLADLLYNFTMADVLADIRADTREACILDELPSSSGQIWRDSCVETSEGGIPLQRASDTALWTPIDPTAWVDDVVILNTCDASELVHRLACTMALCVHR